MYCTELLSSVYCTVLYCTLLDSSVMYCTVLHYNVTYCITLHYTALYCSWLLYIPVCTSLCLNAACCRPNRIEAFILPLSNPGSPAKAWVMVKARKHKLYIYNERRNSSVMLHVCWNLIVLFTFNTALVMHIKSMFVEWTKWSQFQVRHLKIKQETMKLEHDERERLSLLCTVFWQFFGIRKNARLTFRCSSFKSKVKTGQMEVYFL